MKRLSVVILACIFAISVFTACGSSVPIDPNTGLPITSDSPSEQETADPSSAESSVLSQEEETKVESSEESEEESVPTPDSSAEVSVDVSTPGPEGYAEYNNGYIAFSYPLDWEFGAENVNLLLSSDQKSNIVISSEAYSDYYETLTVDSFKAVVVPQVEAAGYKISDIVVKQITNRNGEKLTVVFYKNSSSGGVFYQTLVVATAAETCQCVCLTEVEKSDALYNSLVDNFKVVAK